MCALQPAFAIVLGVALAVSLGSASAQQKFPTKPIRIVIGSTPGATPDILARMIGAKMSDGWGQPVVIENRPGAGGVIGANVVAKSSPDGYTLLLTSPAFAIRAALNPNLPFEPLRDFSGVAEIGFSNTALLVGMMHSVKSVKDLIALAQTQPGKVLFSSPGAGSADHMNGERFRLAAGIKVQHVGFKGQSESLIEVIAGRVHYSCASLTSGLPFIKDGKILALALAQRTSVLPGVPSMAEALPGWGRNGSQAILAPAGTPLAIRQQISKEVARVLSLPDIKERLQAVSFNIAPSTPEEHDRNLRADIVVFTKIVNDAGLRPK